MHKLVVVVVPSFAHRNQRQKEVIAALIGSFVAPRSPNMRKRIDGKRTVKKDYRRNYVSPNESAKAKE